MLEIDGATVYHGNNLDILPTLADNSVDSIVTDPPYELGFMGKKWDSSGIAYNVDLWRECLRVLKPGGHLLSFGGTRTWHRIAVAIEDAGFEVRDSMAWLYGSGFPKSLDVSKAIDKAAGAERAESKTKPTQQRTEKGELLKNQRCSDCGKATFSSNPCQCPKLDRIAITDEAQQWQGWGTALKPAFEPIIVARKPIEGTVAANVLKWGTGGLNIDASRIKANGDNLNGGKKGGTGNEIYSKGLGDSSGKSSALDGRWPANLILDETAAAMLDEQADASRFFYIAKASKRDRNEGLDELEIKRPDTRTEVSMGTFEQKGVQPQRNHHPTVKPTALMEYLIKLVTPPNGIVLDPFTGSGSTGKAALLNGFQFVGIEMTEEYFPIIEGRLRFAASKAAEEKEKGTLF